MSSRKNIKIFDCNGVNVAKHWQGEVFAISDCLVGFDVLDVSSYHDLIIRPYHNEVQSAYNMHIIYTFGLLGTLIFDQFLPIGINLAKRDYCNDSVCALCVCFR